MTDDSRAQPTPDATQPSPVTSTGNLCSSEYKTYIVFAIVEGNQRRVPQVHLSSVWDDRDRARTEAERVAEEWKTFGNYRVEKVTEHSYAVVRILGNLRVGKVRVSQCGSLNSGPGPGAELRFMQA
jgi:CRISPR/Cas system-associated protein endoribonuclease Cas2